MTLNAVYESILDADLRLKGILDQTDLIYSDFFSTESNNRVYIKPENLQKTGAFKIRGAYNKLAQLNEEERKSGLITASAGNHAQGVAYAASLMGTCATIVMPTTTPLIKINATKNYGAEVVLYGDSYDDAYAHALDLQTRRGATMVHPFNDYDVIAGQGTIGKEILDQLPSADIILVPVGGGGLISGIGAYVKSVNPSCRVIGVEPEGAMSMKNALDQGEIVRLTSVHTVADGVAVKAVGEKTFEIAKQVVDEMVAVSDYEIMDSFLMLLEKHKIVSENSGALSLAAIKKLNVKNKTIVSVLSGGNIDVVTVSAMINKGLTKRGRIFCFSVDLPDTPGQLLTISQILSDHKANVIKLDHNQFMNFDRFNHVQLQVTVETNGHEHINNIVHGLNHVGYVVKQVY
ncbi:MAG: threonine ammonia-lyase [Clostridiales bacterium]|nr:threonine ammonia-lyase [Clostridiales bacterium]